MGIAVSRPPPPAHGGRPMSIETHIEVADDPWSSLLPDLLLHIFRRLESTAVIRCAAACKPWPRIIICNGRNLRPFPDRYNPSLLLGFIRTGWYTSITDARTPPPPASILVTAIETGTRCSDRLSSLITPVVSSGGVGVSLCYTTLASRDGYLLLRALRSIHDDGPGLCLYNPMSGDCTFFPVAPAIGQYDDYVLITRYDLSTSGISRDNMGVWILAMQATPFKLGTEGRLTYQVLCCGNDGTAVWGSVQRSEVNKALLTLTLGRNTVVSRDAVHWLGGPRGVGGCSCTVGLDIKTGRTWTTELPKQCQFSCMLITSGDGQLSLLQTLPDHHIQVWVLNSHASAMEWTVQHKICIDEQTLRDMDVYRRRNLESNYPNCICPRSGLLFIMLSDKLQLRIDLENALCHPVQTIRKRSENRYYPYEMDWSTYISEMKNF